MRTDEVPVSETRLVNTAEAPGGIGEPRVPLAPAVANVIFPATGERISTLLIDSTLPRSSS
jgi:isoquinoline 1-oxidoreductase subunit beta